MSNIISILGIQTELIPMQRDKLRGINADMFLRFPLYDGIQQSVVVCHSGKKQTGFLNSFEI